MALPFYNWSRTASANATADATVNWSEGQAPSSVNDSARAMMASTAAYRDDNGGNLSTGGTSTAYTLSSNQVFDTQAHMNAQSLTFQVTVTNGVSPTLNVDGLGAAALMMDGTNVVPTGTMIAGAVYTAVYYSSVNQWRLRDFYQVPFTVPVGGMIDYFGATAPGSNFIFPYGQAISRATYSALFALFSTTYGTGDGSTTFNIPDLRGRIVAGKDDMGGVAASRLSGTSITTGGATTLGGSGGADTKTLLTANLPPYTPAGTNGTSTSTVSDIIRGTTTSSNAAGGPFIQILTSPGSSAITVNAQTFTGTPQGGTSTAFSLAQPTIIANKLLRII